MTNKILAIAGIAIIGSLVSIGSADTVINAVVQQFGATPHTVFETPGGVHNVAIEWTFSRDFNIIDACELTFDKPVPAGTIIVCKVSGHDSNPTDGILNPGPIIGFGQVGPLAVDVLVIRVPVLCDDPATPNPDFILPCDVQDIEDVKVILVGKRTTTTIPPGLAG